MNYEPKELLLKSKQTRLALIKKNIIQLNELLLVSKDILELKKVQLK